VEKDTRNAILIGTFTLLGTILGASIPVIYSSISAPDESYWIAKGNSYFYLANDAKDAIECYDNAIDLKPTSTAWEYKAHALEFLKKYDESAQAYESAFAIQRKPILKYRKALNLDLLGKNEEALEAYNETIELEPNDGNVWNQKGNVLTELDRWTEANAAFAKSKELGFNGEPGTFFL
jgi:tetratricopeptide (TPR) repeat protein